ncbi:MAG: hypothetical protein LQ346_008679 [Caloplaca aetnensis]|nr:MAG: hypothetical protein LQ346_008679 [Caloplaca aetnensis]
MTDPENRTFDNEEKGNVPEVLVGLASESVVDKKSAATTSGKESLQKSESGIDLSPSISSSSKEGEPLFTPSSSTSPHSGLAKQVNQSLLEKLEPALCYLKDGDDTSKFIGLSQLRSILVENPELRFNQDLIFNCWVAIPPRFLFRLLRATDYRGERTLDRDYIFGLAVAIIHAVPSLLSGSSGDGKEFHDQIPRLLAALKSSPPDTNAQILEVLVMANAFLGPTVLLAANDWSILWELAVQHGIVLQLIELTYAAAQKLIPVTSRSHPKLHETISGLVAAFRDTADKTPLFDCVMKLGSYIPRVSITQVDATGEI